jgi:hypothetical protein
MANFGKIRTWIEGIQFLVFSNLESLEEFLIPWMKFFNKDFHPWDLNNMDSIEYWKKQITQKSTA